MSRISRNVRPLRRGKEVFWGVLCLCVALAFVNSKTDVYVDDLFITLSYAQNLASGKGMVFQGNEYVLGTTSPLWCVLNAFALRAGSLVAGDPLSGTRFLFLLATFAAALGIVRLCYAFGASWLSWFGGLHYVLHLEHASLFGYETSLATCLACLGLLGLYCGRPIQMGIVSGLLCIARPEAAILPVLILGADYYMRGFRHSVRAIVTFGLVVGISALVLTVTFGSPIPHTLAAKRAQQEQYTLWISVLLGAKNYLLAKIDQESMISFVILAGFIRTIRKFMHGRSSSLGFMRCSGRRLLPLLILVWPLLHVSSLTLLGIAFYDWYLYPLWMSLSVLTGVGLAQVHSILRNQCRNRKATSIQALPVVIPGLLFLYLALVKPWSGDPVLWQRDRYKGYRILANTASINSTGMEATLWTREIGVLRYYLPENVQVLDGYYLVRKLPASGIIPSTEKQVEQLAPDYIVESLPSSPLKPGLINQNQEMRLDPKYTYQVRKSDGSLLSYRVVHCVRSQYGVQVLLRKST